MSRTLRLLALSSAVLLATVLAACGEKQESASGDREPFVLALDFYVNPDHAGIYTALDRGYFDDAGLEVEPRVPSDPSAPIREVAAGRVDLAVSYEPEVLLAREQGLPVKAVAALVPRPLTSLISLPEAGIAEVSDLRGKTIATAGIPYQGDYLAAILERVGLSLDDVSQVDVGLNLLPAVLSGRADAMLGGFLNVEGVDLAERGKHPRVVPVDRLGIPTYDELVLVASSDRLEEDTEAIRLFIAALERGTEAAAKNPEGAAAAILRAGQGLDPQLTDAEIDRTLPLLQARPGKPYGYMDPAAWERFAVFFAERGLISDRPTADELLTNELVPDR
ncbi:MAG TPA: ABC transporter substrate-binding protein [Solirubrobacterales bacterium]|nr:ABC transporter substrate-binding protein [Solirubrobacterales bacterium]